MPPLKACGDEFPGSLAAGLHLLPIEGVALDGVVEGGHWEGLASGKSSLFRNASLFLSQVILQRRDPLQTSLDQLPERSLVLDRGRSVEAEGVDVPAAAGLDLPPA